MHTIRMARALAGTARRAALLGVAALGLGCDIFDTEIENPNAVVEDAFATPVLSAQFCFC